MNEKERAREDERFDNATGILVNNEGKKETQIDSQLETKNKKEEGYEGVNRTNTLRNQTTTVKPTTVVNKRQEFVRVDSVQKGRRPITHRTVARSKTSEFPLMSPERRNSYLSIAERRKYYNRTQERIKKPKINGVEPENQETTNKVVTPSVLETLQTNEIHVSRKPSVKETNKGNQESSLTKNIIQNASDKQSTRQSVIQSQYEFGQKLILRRPVGESTIDGRSDNKTLWNSEKSRTNYSFTGETTTGRLLQSNQVHSTELLKINKETTSTTTVPSPLNGESDKSAVGGGNKTNVIKLVEYVTANRTHYASNAMSDSVNPTSLIDYGRSENGSRSQELKLKAIKSPPLPLDIVSPLGVINDESDDEGDDKMSESQEGKKNLTDNNRNVYDPEILPLNGTRKSGRGQSNITKEFNMTQNSDMVTPDTSEHLNVTSTHPPLILSNLTQKNAVEPSVTSSNVKSNVTALKASNVRGSNETSSDLGQRTTVSSSEVPVRRPILSPKEANVPATKDEDDKVPSTQTRGEVYPVTIELNKNNKRILSEMFDKTTESTGPSNPTAGIEQSPVYTSVKGTTEETTSEVTSSVTDIIIVRINKTATESQNVDDVSRSKGRDADMEEDFQEEDRKPMGTRYNTKFYISPNISRVQQKVIKVVVNEDDDEEENRVTPLSHPIGITSYVLAAFGIIPLLLAAVFAGKFLMQRRQRQYECELDRKSDSIATGDCQSKNKKSSSDLKKSPSNVTTTTLVNTSRLPRVQQQWDNSEKQSCQSTNWEIPRSKLRMKTILGQGNFGQVWKAEIEDGLGHSEGKVRMVAVKTVKEGAGEKEHKEFIKELEIMQQIGSHPNIVTLLGCCTDHEPYYLIMEYVKYGKLLTFLRDHRINENYYNFSNKEDALTSKDLTVFAYCIARGMEYLVTRGIIHRDLAARNVLVDHNKVCKIADFGMSRSVRNLEDGQVYEERQHKGALPIRWMAPESLVYSMFTYKSDVWSFGVVMWEIVTLGSTPYPNMGAREIMRRVRDGYRLERPSHCKPEFYRLMSHCWFHDPNKRPGFSELREDLSNLLENPSKNGSYVDLDQFAVDNGFHISNKFKDLRLLGRQEHRSLKRTGEWEVVDWPEETKRSRMKKNKNNGKGTITLTGQGSFTVNSRILEKEFKMM
ncbi:hypothetical protein RUM43_010872 [Polyplax serrata]|uniref:receptor protein-tyrosine kinase n=1 Tax=Polyplax serrata TaxID=468196 RepID=A0AAN8RZJ2_POLSC